MGNISEFIRQRDLEGHHNEVYFAGKGSYKSRTGGCVSLCFIAIVLVIIYFKVVDELQKNHIKVNTEIVKNDFTKI